VENNRIQCEEHQSYHYHKSEQFADCRQLEGLASLRYVPTSLATACRKAIPITEASSGQRL
jgi:hypothetical protein